jgi:ABC-type transporter Mla subunit MlaD
MLIKDNDAVARLQSPLNLINKLRSDGSRKSAMSLFIPPVTKKIEEVIPTFNPFKEEEKALTPSSPAIEDLIKDSEQQVKLTLAHDKALELLNRSVDLLSAKLDDVRADKLPSVITSASKVVEGIRRERLERESDSDREVHYHFYTPTQKKITEYEVIDVG